MSFAEQKQYGTQRKGDLKQSEISAMQIVTGPSDRLWVRNPGPIETGGHFIGTAQGKNSNRNLFRMVLTPQLPQQCRFLKYNQKCDCGRGLDEARQHPKLLRTAGFSEHEHELIPESSHTFSSTVSLLSHVLGTQVFFHLVAPFSSVAAVAFPWQCCADGSARSEGTEGYCCARKPKDRTAT